MRRVFAFCASLAWSMYAAPTTEAAIVMVVESMFCALKMLQYWYNYGDEHPISYLSLGLWRGLQHTASCDII